MHVLFCNWRDTRNPEGGGSELYVETIARGLADRGHEVTIACAAHDNAPSREVVDGVRFARHGTKLGVYVQTFLRLLLRRYGRVDVVVDVQNGLPFFTRWATRRPVVVLVHHVHREQWPVVYPGRVGRIGWWIESRLAPRLYRRSHYVAVSSSTRSELVDLGVDTSRISVVRNGVARIHDADVPPSPTPRILTLGRLVPHKQVEHAIDAVAALRGSFPGLALDVVGDGWWAEDLRTHAASLGVSDAVRFHGFVGDDAKQHLIGEAWVLALPSLKEGWGIVVGEAALHHVPTVAYSTAGGTTESIDHKTTGMLVETPDELVEALREILADAEWRRHLGQGALTKFTGHTWAIAQSEFAGVLERVVQE